MNAEEDIEVIDFRKLDLGCGKFRKRGFLGIDNLQSYVYQGMTEEDKKWILIFDLDNAIPFPDNTITDVLISHFLEHVKSPKYFLQEVWRVCVANAHVEVYVPLHEMKSVGHLTEFGEYWFEDFFLNEMPGYFSIVRKQINHDKNVKVLVARETTTEDLVFDELNIMFKVVK